MPEIKSFDALQMAADQAFKGNLLLVLEAHGVPKSALMTMCLDTAETIRATAVSPALVGGADLLARQYEDLANILSGNGLLPR